MFIACDVVDGLAIVRYTLYSVSQYYSNAMQCNEPRRDLLPLSNPLHSALCTLHSTLWVAILQCNATTPHGRQIPSMSVEEQPTFHTRERRRYNMTQYNTTPWKHRRGFPSSYFIVRQKPCAVFCLPPSIRTFETHTIQRTTLRIRVSTNQSLSKIRMHHRDLIATFTISTSPSLYPSHSHAHTHTHERER